MKTTLPGSPSRDASRWSRRCAQQIALRGRLLSIGLACCGLLLGAAPLSAENVLTFGFAEAVPGAKGVPVIITAHTDAPIHGYSLAFTYPVPDLRLQALSVAGTHVGTMEPEFVSPGIDNALGVGTLGVIFDFDSPIEPRALSATPDTGSGVIVARLTFEVRSFASGGHYPLELLDGLGQPPSFNRFTNAGTSIAPRLVNGSLVVGGGDAIILEQKRALPGASPNLEVLAYAQHSEPLTGFQIGFTYDKNALTIHPDYVVPPPVDGQGPPPPNEDLFNALFRGTSVLQELGAEKIEFWSVVIEPDFTPARARVETAVSFDFLDETFDGQTLSPSFADPPTQSICRFVFSVNASAADTQEFQELRIEDSPSDTVLNNRFFTPNDSTLPRFVSGNIYFSTGRLLTQVLNADDLTGVPGARVTSVPGGLEATTDANGNFEILDIPAGRYTLQLSADGYYSRQTLEVVVGGGGRSQQLAPIVLHPIIETPDEPFVRGDCDGDGAVAGVVTDAIFILNFNFLGGTSPGCLAACDADGDGEAQGVVTDAVFLLNFNFLGGLAPLAPFPSCGGGSALDAELGCEIASAGCN